MATEINGSSANVKLNRHGDGSYSAWNGRFKIRKVQSELDSDYYYTIDDTTTGDLLRGPSRRLDDVKETIERFLLKESREQREAAEAMEPEYPEHEKLHKIKHKSQAIGEFLDWLRHDKGVLLAEYVDKAHYPRPFRFNTQDLLAEYFGIDRDKIEAEKQEILRRCRQVNEEQV